MAAVQIMGILNVTPDSFSDGGSFVSASAAVDQALRLIDEGADIIDIGGESTRPFASPVELDEELKRTIPVIELIRKQSSTPISIDTTKEEVARRALDAGADIINDISAFSKDPQMVSLASSRQVPVIIMHMQNNPADMQVAPKYDDVVEDIVEYLRKRTKWLVERGIDPSNITIDPGIGFGKSLQHNLSLIKHLKRFSELGFPVLLGHSRKRFLGDITGEPVEDRDLATAVVSALAVTSKVSLLRVHDVASTRVAVELVQAITSAP